ncbi:MAG: hypothetical protein L6R37_008336 [Teloschistes peruensis]|nr:MAG: hypothetical protein L6R37_008336 [Teloschistes peruensis]
MPLQTQLSLSIELAKAFPLREAINSGVEQLVNLVRALKKNGSDFLVEADLADIFGRGKIEPPLEKEFRDVIKIGTIQPLHADSPIVLDAGPGATVRRAIRDSVYMSCVIQLSFLGWFHEESTLAETLVENMLTRFDLNVPGATADPDYEGILKTLHACSSQTSQYRWDDLVALVETRFPHSTRFFRLYQSPLRFLSSNLLLGAMDYLYLAQSLPEDRIIVTDNQMGLIPMVIWAHYILGLTVIIKSCPDGDVAFGNVGNPQVIIKWSSVLFPQRPRSDIHERNSPYGPAPTMYLLDADWQVVLETKPIPNGRIMIEAQESHRLKGYGTTFLRRWFNRKLLIADDDEVYVGTANFAVSFSIIICRVMRRVPFSDHGNCVRKPENDVPSQCYLSTEHWRILNASETLLSGIKLDKRKISDFVESLSGKSLEDMAIPIGVKAYLDKLNEEAPELRKLTFLEEMKQLASWILSFAQVINIDSCADLPLRIAPGWMFCDRIISWNGLDKIDIDSDIWFNMILKLMRKDSTGGSSIVESTGTFLTCHQGWSLFYSCVGNKHDPGEINCELLCIERGVPTNTRTGERKYRIADAPPIEEDVGTPKLMDRETYVPRSVTKVHKRVEHYSSRSEEFWLSVKFDIEEVDFQSRTAAQRTGVNQRYSLYASYAQFQEALWGVVKTLPCPHRNEDSGSLSLDLDTRTAAGLIWTNGDGNAGGPGHRILICLVKGDAMSRWLVINNIMPGSALNRHVLLRCDDCCEDCAVKAAGTMKGNWLVVL